MRKEEFMVGSISLDALKRKSLREKKVEFIHRIELGEKKGLTKKMSNLIWQGLTGKIKDLSMAELNIKFTRVEF